MRLNVAVTSAGSAPAVAVIKALKKQNEIICHITAMDMDPLSSGNYLADDIAAIPASGAPGFIDKVLAACRRHEVQCLIPIIDEELFVFSAAIDRFNAAGIKVIVNDAKVIRLAKDKRRAYHFCAQNNILFPRVFSATDIAGIKAADYPLIIKPNDGRGSLDTAVIKDKNELDFFKEHLNGRIIQRFIGGPEFTIDIVASPDGSVLQAVPRRRLSVKAGMSYKGETVNDRRIIEYGKKVAALFKINGPANIQCIVNEEKIYLIEVNPKFAAGLPLTVAAGVNLPLILIKSAYGLKVAKNELKFKDKLFMLRYWEEIFIEG
ncbi:MAG: ATP-grasp domain-containing protein [Candidatus Omnitrophota bacterium]|nr:ATP-grasp domain-containing protein [Candidatus Omnitrophota bacterium]